MYIKTIFGEIENIFGLETYCIFQLYFKISYPEMHKVHSAKCAIGYQEYVGLHLRMITTRLSLLLFVQYTRKNELKVKHILAMFTVIWTWRTSWSSDQHHVIKFSFPCT